MENIENKIRKSEDVLFETNSLLELMHGYCVNKSEKLEEMDYLLSALNIIIQNQNSLRNTIDSISCDICMLLHPHYFE